MDHGAPTPAGDVACGMSKDERPSKGACARGAALYTCEEHYDSATFGSVKFVPQCTHT
jgi:hypothetical protein